MIHDVNPAAMCPSCKWPIESSTLAAGEHPGRGPEPGELSVCLRCSEFLVFKPDLTLRLLSYLEFLRLPAEVQDMLRSAGARAHIARNLEAADEMVKSMGGKTEYHVHQFLTGGTCVNEPDGPLSAMMAVMRASELSRTVAATSGTTCRIIITNGAGYTVWEWRYGEGLVFPAPGEQHSG